MPIDAKATGLKNRPMTARDGGSGWEFTPSSRGLNKRPNGPAAVPPLPGEGSLWVTFPEASSQGYPIAGIQPYSEAVLNLPPIYRQGNVKQINGNCSEAD